MFCYNNSMCLEREKSSPLKRADRSPSLWSPSVLQRVQHVVLADVEPHTKEQVVPAGLHKEEAARAQVRAHCHCLWHGRVWESLHSAQCHMLTVHLETKCKSKVRRQKVEEERKEYWFCAWSFISSCRQVSTSYPGSSIPWKASTGALVGHKHRGRMLVGLWNQNSSESW